MGHRLSSCPAPLLPLNQNRPPLCISTHWAATIHLSLTFTEGQEHKPRQLIRPHALNDLCLMLQTKRRQSQLPPLLHILRTCLGLQTSSTPYPANQKAKFNFCPAMQPKNSHLQAPSHPSILHSSSHTKSSTNIFFHQKSQNSVSLSATLSKSTWNSLQLSGRIGRKKLKKEVNLKNKNKSRLSTSCQCFQDSTNFACTLLCLQQSFKLQSICKFDTVIPHASGQPYYNAPSKGVLNVTHHGTFATQVHSFSSILKNALISEFFRVIIHQGISWHILIWG